SVSNILNLRSIKSADIKLDIFSQNYTKEEYSNGDSIFQCIRTNFRHNLRAKKSLTLFLLLPNLP
ncbi:hypothetical protein KZ377_09415, partial [Glaesserella parasuis]|nr:hypothetical protein [Glaesserella parasuis]